MGVLGRQKESAGSTRARWIPLLGTFALLALSLSVAFPSLSPAAACTASVATVTRTSSPTLYYGKPTSGYFGHYAAYRITNTGAAMGDLWVKAQNFSGPTISLGGNEDGIVHIGALASGASATAFIYLQTNQTATAGETHNIALYPSRPDLVAPSCTQGFSLASAVTISASPNSVTAVTVNPTNPQLGGLMTIKVLAKKHRLALPQVPTPSGFTKG